MKMCISTIGGPIETREFSDSDTTTLVFNSSIRVAHSYIIGDCITFGIDVGSMDFLEFDHTDRKSVYVTLASIETMKSRCKAMAEDEEDEKWKRRNEYSEAM